MEIIVDTAKIINVANDIKQVNSVINKGFYDRKKAVISTLSSWNSSAATEIKGVINASTKYEKERNKQFNNFYLFLKEEVALNYEITETNNTNLADLFR